ncbi:MAG: PepSY-like domain-containing protein [Flavobacterium sp.]
MTKTIRTTAILFVMMAGFTANAQDRIITVKELPARAQTFINQHYKGVAVVQASEDKDLFETDYKVYLTNGTEIDFDDDGYWEEIENKRNALPGEVVPQQIAKHIKKHHKFQKITQIDKNHDGYDVTLANGTELEFDRQRNFVKYDD